MKEQFQAAKKLIDQSSRILLTMHERMDGDDGGSVLAMHHHLEKAGKNVTSAIKKGVPPALAFLPGSYKVKDDIEHENYDLLITFGCSSLSRTGSNKIVSLKTVVINIDHHPDNENFGQVNIVDPNKSSVAEIIYDFFLHHNWSITKEVATCLLTGLVTDTGSFMHNNTKASTLKVAAELLRKGGQINHIVRQTYKNKSPQTLKAWGKALENIFYDGKNKIVYSVMTEKDLSEVGELPQAAFEGFTEMLNTIPEAKFAMFLKQDGKIIKGSLRSDKFKNTDVAAIAKVFGGGGHKLAAGFSVAGKLIKDELGRWKVV